MLIFPRFIVVFRKRVVQKCEPFTIRVWVPSLTDPTGTMMCLPLLADPALAGLDELDQILHLLQLRKLLLQQNQGIADGQAFPK